MHVTIVSPEKILFDGQAKSVAVPGGKGRFEVLENHAPIISNLVEGNVSLDGGNTFKVKVKGGFVEVTHNEVSLCVEALGA